MRIVSLSFDDGTVYDERFIELLNKYNIRATLNLNSGLKDFVWYYGDTPIKRLDLCKVKEIYAPHEVASHSLTHPYFSSLAEEEIAKEVQEDIKNLSRIFSRDIAGFAFPFHDQTEENIQTVIGCADLKYIRYSFLTDNCTPADRYHIPINALYDDPDIYEKLNTFRHSSEEHSLFVIAGHSYEFEVKDDWQKIEALLSFLSEAEDLTILTLADAADILFPLGN